MKTKWSLQELPHICSNSHTHAPWNEQSPQDQDQDQRGNQNPQDWIGGMHHGGRKAPHPTSSSCSSTSRWYSRKLSPSRKMPFLAILENKIFKLWSPQCVVCFITQNLNPNNIYIRIRSQKHSSLTSDLSWLIFVGDYNQTWPLTTQHQGQSRFSSGVHKLIIWSSFIMTIIIRIIMIIIVISMLWVKAHSNLTQLGVRSNLFRITSCAGNLKDSNITFQIL